MEIVLGIVLFTLIIMTLVWVILSARSKLVPTGDVSVLINSEKTITCSPGGKLLGALADADLFV
jgi:Na+-transporting NADH:ubiquinone oxidoreductase subunit F